jgi:uncharacterized SAM-dependent methyltransferase
MTVTAEGIPIQVRLGPDEWASALRREAAAGLTASPKELPPTWLYDDRGCELFEAITRLPEYYLTRTDGPFSPNGPTISPGAPAPTPSSS